jgi:hypothetical protein
MLKEDARSIIKIYTLIIGILSSRRPYNSIKFLQSVNRASLIAKTGFMITNYLMPHY